MHWRALLRHQHSIAAWVYLIIGSLLVGTFATPTRADEIDQVHAQILLHPADSQLNLRFAALAENSGKLRWALAAYERVLLNDPNNIDALAGLQRVRRALQPNVTLLTLQLGAQYESNPWYYIPPRRPEAEVLGSAALLDERNLGGIRWRTNAVAAGLVHTRSSDLTYAVAGGETGPVFDVWPGWSFHPAAGGSAALFDNRFYYGEGSVSGTLQSASGGIYREAVFRSAYRSYDDFFPSGEGWYYEARGKVAAPNLLGPGTAVIVSPFAVWSRVSGVASVVTPIITDLQPGAYDEYGGRVDLLRGITEWLVVGFNLTASRRSYRNDVVAATLAKRHDTIVVPGASLTFPNVVADQMDLRFEYRYLHDQSTDPTKTFDDHIITTSIIAHFDPTLPPPWARQNPGAR